MWVRKMEMMEQVLGSRTRTLCEEGHLEKRCDLGLREVAAHGDTEGGSQEHKDPDLIPSSLWSLVETPLGLPPRGPILVAHMYQPPEHRPKPRGQES